MKIKELLSDESKWTKKTYARTKDNKMCNYIDDEAYCFCLMGALYRCYGLNNYAIVNLIQNKLNHKSCNIPQWNDNLNTTFEDVKELVEELDI